MEANRCSISSNDCELAREYLDALIELQEKDEDSGISEFFMHREGLLIAAIISYSRAFTTSRGMEFASPLVKVNLGNVFENDRNKIELHKHILNKRNKAAAHSDWEFHKAQLIEVTEGRGVLRKRPVVMYGEGIDIPLFREMTEIMRNHFLFEQHMLDTGRK
jgi:hypothetical protein